MLKRDGVSPLGFPLKQPKRGTLKKRQTYVQLAGHCVLLSGIASLYFRLIRSIGWLAGRLVGWLVGWLVACSLACVRACLRVLECLHACLVAFLLGWLFVLVA